MRGSDRRLVAAAITSPAVRTSLTACSMTPYEECVKSATDNWSDQKKREINQGGSVGSISDGIQSLESAISDACGIESDPRWAAPTT